MQLTLNQYTTQMNKYDKSGKIHVWRNYLEIPDGFHLEVWEQKNDNFNYANRECYSSYPSCSTQPWINPEGGWTREEAQSFSDKYIAELKHR